MGRLPERNNVSPAKGLAVEWSVGQFDRNTDQWLGKGSKNIRWAARLGKDGFGSPIVAAGKVFCASNNEAGYLPRYPAAVDLGCLLCFDRASGRFLWQHSAPKLRSRDRDYGKVGMCSCPLVEGNRLWIVTNRSEVVCLDTEGAGSQDSRVLWSFDMIGSLGTSPRYMSNCSVTSAGDLLFVCTSHGRDVTTDRLPAPQAPSFIALDKRTGKLVWADNSPGENILDGQWSSPAYGVLGGVPQVIFGGGDGWLYSFEGSGFRVQGSGARKEGARDQGLGAREEGPGARQVDGSSSPTPSPQSLAPSPQPLAPRPKLLWKFDCNPKESVWEGHGSGQRNIIVSTPVICDGRVYIATGQDPESAGDGQGDLWCIDPTRRSDTSAELVVDRAGKPVPHQARSAADKSAVDKDVGQKVLPNPNSAAIWHYRGRQRVQGSGFRVQGSGARAEGLGTRDEERGAGDTGHSSSLAPSPQPPAPFENVMHRSLGMPAIQDGLLVIGDFAGLVHCLDVKTGQVLWTHDCMSAIWGTPLVAEGRVYIGTQDGDVLIFALAREKKLLAKNPMVHGVHGTPVAAGNVLYIATATHLFAIAAGR